MLPIPLRRPAPTRMLFRSQVWHLQSCLVFVRLDLIAITLRLWDNFAPSFAKPRFEKDLQNLVAGVHALLISIELQIACVHVQSCAEPQILKAVGHVVWECHEGQGAFPNYLCEAIHPTPNPDVYESIVLGRVL